MHGLRSRRQLGMLRSLWQARDDMARKRDVAPGRVLPDSAMVSAVQADPAQRGRAARAAGVPRPGEPAGSSASGSARSPAAGPSRRTSCRCRAGPGEGPPPVNRWADRDPAAATRLQAARASLARDLGEALGAGGERALPRLVRRIMWTRRSRGTLATVTEALRAGGAREWQIELTAAVLTEAVATA